MIDGMCRCRGTVLPNRDQSDTSISRLFAQEWRNFSNHRMHEAYARQCDEIDEVCHRKSCVVERQQLEACRAGNDAGVLHSSFLGNRIEVVSTYWPDDFHQPSSEPIIILGHESFRFHVHRWSNCHLDRSRLVFPLQGVP